MNKNDYFSSPRLQIALDFLSLNTALKIALKVKESVDIFEAGTPLIKAEGIKVVSEIKRSLPDKLVLADMKTLDVGWTEVSMAAEAGADIVSVSGLAPEEVIQESARAAKERNVLLQADLLGVKDQIERAIELKKLGVDIICAHTAIDQEKSRISFQSRVDIVNKIVEETALIVSAAGGLNLNNIGQIVKARARIIVVGRAITECEDPEKNALLFKKEIYKNFRWKGIQT